MRKLQRCLGAVVLILLLVPAFLVAQQQPAGVVTTLQGTAELTRPTQPLPTSLRFKDAIFVRDVINTKEKSIARVLFGGKSTVTVRELSRLEVREENLPGGASRSIHELTSGAILVNVAKQLTRPGDEVQIRTPNAVAAVRGTILYVDCAAARTAPSCNFTVLTGDVTLTPQGRPSVNLPANSTARVTGSPATGVQVSPVTAIAPTQAAQILQQFDVQLALTQEANQQQIAAAQTEQASQLARAVVATITGIDPGPTPNTTTTTQSQQATSSSDQQTSQDQQAAQEAAQVIQTALASTSTTSSTGSSTVISPTTPASGPSTVAPITPTIPSQANLSVTRTPPPASVTVGNDFTYTITVTNDGPSSATGVTLVDSLPAGVTLVSATSSQGSCSAGSSVSCSLGTIDSGSSSTVTVTARATEAGSITETATASLDKSIIDPDTSNNSSIAQTVAVAPPPVAQDLVITSATDPNASTFDTGAPVSFRTITQSGGTLTGSDAVTASNAYGWTGGTQSGTGSTNIPEGSTLTMSGPADKTLDRRTLNNTGTASFGGGPLFLNNGALFNNSGTFTAQDATAISSSAGTAGSFNNSGTFNRSGANTETVISVPFNNNAGSVQIDSGTLKLSGGGTGSGSFSGAGTLDLAGNYTFAPASNVTTSSVIFESGTASVQGTYDLAGSSTTVSGGTANFTGTLGNVGNLSISGGTANFSSGETVAPTSLALSGGTLTGTDTLNLTGAVNTWTGGTQSGGGTTNVQSGATLGISGTASKTLDARTLNNAGTANVGGTNVFLSDGAVINNTGSFNILDGVNISGAPNGTFNNMGTFTKTGAGTSTTFSNVQVNNSGSVDVQAGALRLLGGVSNSGTMQAESGAALEIQGSFTNAGTITASTGGTVNLDNAGAHSGTFNIGGNLNHLSGLVSAAAGETLNPTGTILNINGGSVTANGATPLFNLTGGILNVLGANKFLLSMSGGSATLGGRMLGLSNGSSATINSLFSLSGNSSLALDNALVSVAGGSSFQLTGNSLGSFGSGANTLSFTNAPLCSSGTCVPILSTGFNILLTNGAVISNVSIDPTFAGFSGLGDTNTVGGVGSNQAIIVVDGATSTLALGSNALPNLVVTSGTTDFSSGINRNFFLAAISGGTLTGSDTVNIAGSTSWSGGTMSGTGITNANGGLDISGASAKTLDRRTLNNLATAIWSGTGNILLDNGAVFNNPSESVFQVQNDSAITSNTLHSPGTFNNSGDFEKIGGTGTTTVATPFNNTGNVSIQTGTLALLGGGVDYGYYTVANGATLNYENFTSAANFNLANGATLNLGSNSLAGGTLNGAGNVNVNADAVVNIDSSSADRLTGTLKVNQGGLLNVTGDLIQLTDSSLHPLSTAIKSAGAPSSFTATFINNQDVDVPVLPNVSLGSEPADSIAMLKGERTTSGTVDLAYVPLPGANQIKVIDANTNSVINTISVGTTPTKVAATPDGERVFVLNSGSSNVSVIDTHTNAVIATIATGSGPDAVAFTPDSNRAFVTNSATNTVTVINVDTNAAIVTVPVGSNPGGAAVTPDGTRVYVTNQFSNTVSVISTATNTVTNTISVGNGPVGVKVTPDGLKVGVVNQSSNTLSIIDALTNNVVATVPVGTMPTAGAITPNGATALIVNLGSNNVTVVDIATHSAVATISVGTAPADVVISSDSRRAYVANSGSNSISVIDIPSNSVIATLSTGSSPVALALTRENGTLFNLFAVNSNSNDVSVTHVVDLSDMVQLTAGAALSSTSNLPLLDFDQSFVSTGGSLMRVADPGSAVTLSGPLVKANGNTILNLDRGALRILNGGSLTGNGVAPLMQFDSSIVNTVSQFVNVEGTGSKLDLSAPLLTATNSFLTLGANFTLDSQFLAFREGSQVTSSSASPFVSFIDSGVLRASHFFLLDRSVDNVAPAASMQLAGPLLSATGSTFFTTQDFISIREKAMLTGTGTDALIQSSNSSFVAGDPSVNSGIGNDFVRVDNSSSGSNQGPASVKLAGPLLIDTGSTFSILDRFLRVTDGSTFASTTTQPLIQLDGSSVTTGSNMVLLNSATDGIPPTMTLDGPLLSATNATNITSGGTFISVGDSATFNGPPKPVLGDAPALISFGNSNLTATGTSPLFMVRSSLTPGNPSTANLGGPLLSAAGSSFNLTGSSYVLVAENGRITGSGATPLIQSDNSQFTTSSNFLSVTDVSTVNPGTPGPATVNLAGPFIADTGSTFNMGGRFSFVGGASSVTTGQFAGLSGTTVNTGNDFAQITETGSKMTLSGPMLSANGGSLNIGTNPSAGGDVLDVNSGGQLVVNSNEPVIAFNGGSIAVGTADATTNNTPNRVARLQGDTVNGISPVTGLGTFQPVIGNGSSPAPFAGATHPIGTLIQATGGAAIQVNAGAGDTVGGGVGPGNAIQVDRALFEAALPMIKLIGTGTTNTTTASSLTTANGTMDIFQSKVVSNGSVIALDNGLISVNNGPLITLRNGSTMDVTGDLLTLTNHSQINVVNGPLIRVTGNSGNGSSPSVSTLNVSGALVNFGGTGGNTIVVNNDIAPNGTVSGIPVSGNNFSIGPNPIKNSGLGSIIVNGATVGSASSFTGSLIQTQNGGRVNILAP